MFYSVVFYNEDTDKSKKMVQIVPEGWIEEVITNHSFGVKKEEKVRTQVFQIDPNGNIVSIGHAEVENLLDNKVFL